jgi:DNA modification methylase
LGTGTAAAHRASSTPPKPHARNDEQRDEQRDPDLPGGNNPRNRGAKLVANHHPTVKPLDLMQWLCRLVTPKGGLILDPFTGSGSTGRAAVAEGFRFVGIELSEEYATIARARIADYAPLFNDGAA